MTTYDTGTARHRGDWWRIPRSRGATSGLLLLLLGVWSAIIPFVGPYFDYAFTPNTTWTWTSARFWLEVLPGAATVLGGLLLLVSIDRGTASLGAWLASAAGAWLVLGPSLAPLWDPGSLGVPVGGTTRQVLEWIGFFYGPGVAILFLGAAALGRLSVRAVRDVEAARHWRAVRAARRTGAAVPAPAGEHQVYPGDPHDAEPVGQPERGQPERGVPERGGPEGGRPDGDPRPTGSA